jgi:hypothetical protein
VFTVGLCPFRGYISKCDRIRSERLRGVGVGVGIGVGVGVGVGAAEAREEASKSVLVRR